MYVSNNASVLYEVGTAYPSRAAGFTPGFCVVVFFVFVLYRVLYVQCYQCLSIVNSVSLFILYDTSGYIRLLHHACVYLNMVVFYCLTSGTSIIYI